VEIAAKLTSKGQITVPKAVPDFIELAGSISVPTERRNAAWDDVLRTTRAARADARR
jgi:antitoxin PrlF